MDWVDHYRRHFRQQLAARGVTAWPDEAPASEPAPVPPPVPADTPLGPSAVAAPRPTPQHDPAPVELNQDALLALGRGIDRRLSGRVPPALVRHMVKAIPELMPRVLQEAVADKLRERKAPKPDRPLSKSEAFIQHNAAIRATELVPEIRLYLADEITPIWEATEESLKEQGLPPPFWAFAWPGGQGLARFLLDHPQVARGHRVLDFAAGCGIASIAARMAGAKHVLASEIDSFAVTAIALNADLNDVDVEPFLGDLIGRPAEDWDVVLVGDMCYEQPLADRMTAWLRDLVTAGTPVLLADPGRSYLPKDGLERLASYRVPTTRELEDRVIQDVTIYQVRAV